MSETNPLSGITRRRLLQGAAALAAGSVLPGCTRAVGAPAVPATPSLNPQPLPPGPVTPALVTVSGTPAGELGPAFTGFSYEKSMLTKPPLFTASNAGLVALFKLLGTGVLRIGGNSVDRNVWTPAGPGRTSGQIAPSDVDSLAGFVKATGWQVLYGVNLGGSADGATTPALAAQEVAYAQQQFGSSLLGIEIGNEPDFYGHAANHYAGNWSYAQFTALWNQYRDAVLATTPGVTVTGPASAKSVNTWTVPFAHDATAKKIKLLTQHYYRADGRLPTSTVEYLVTPDPKLVSDLALLKTAAQGIGVPYRLAECNSYYHGGADNVSDAYASALWIIDFFFDCALGGASGVNFHSGGNGKGYTPIADAKGIVQGVRPEFYGILLSTLAGRGILRRTTLSATSLNVTAYALTMASGGTSLILVNKDSTQNIAVTATLPQTVRSASLIEMTQSIAGAAPSLSATSGVTIQGATVNANGSFAPQPAYTLTTSGTQLTCYVPALSAVLITVS